MLFCYLPVAAFIKQLLIYYIRYFFIWFFTLFLDLTNERQKECFQVCVCILLLPTSLPFFCLFVFYLWLFQASLVSFTGILAGFHCNDNNIPVSFKVTSLETVQSTKFWIHLYPCMSSFTRLDGQNIWFDVAAQFN